MDTPGGSHHDLPENSAMETGNSSDNDNGEDNGNSICTAEDIIYFLLKQRPFFSLSYDDKLYVKSVARPCPDLSTTLIINGQHNRAFANSWYDKCQWLVGSKHLKKLFCWPCLLFASNSNSGETVWSRTGYSDLKNLPRSIERHTKSKVHIGSSCKLKLFGKMNIVTALDSARKIEIENYNIQVKENRTIMKKLIDVTIYLCTQEQTFRGHNEKVDSFNRGNFKELLELMCKFDPLLQTFLQKDDDKRSVFSGTSKTIQNELIESIGHILDKKIDKEIANAPFFSWQIDETTDIGRQAQLSVIFRFIKEGEIIERFMGFLNVTNSRAAEDLFELLTQKFESYNLPQKLTSQTYDGAPVMAGNLNGLQAKIKTIAPYAIFTHCYAHKLNLVLGKACSGMQEVRIFLASLSGFSAYFSNSTKRTTVLDDICKKRLPTNAPTRWNFTSRSVFTVKNYREPLIEVFDTIINSDDFDDISIREAVGLKKTLEDYKFVFFLETFNLIFQQTDVAFAILQHKLTDITKARTLLQSLSNKLQEIRSSDNFFSNIYDQLDTESVAAPRRRRVGDIPDAKQQLRKTFFEILDITINQLEVRFADLKKLHFVDLLDISKFPTFAKSFPENQFKSLLEQYIFF